MKGKRAMAPAGGAEGSWGGAGQPLARPALSPRLRLAPAQREAGPWNCKGTRPGSAPRSEERRVGKECVAIGVDLGGRRIIQAEDGIRDVRHGDWSSDVCSSDLNVLECSCWQGPRRQQVQPVHSSTEKTGPERAGLPPRRQAGPVHTGPRTSPRVWVSLADPITDACPCGPGDSGRGEEDWQ